MKPTNQSSNGTSFHGEVFNASVQDVKKICGEPYAENNDGSDKVNFEWEMETENGDVFTIYDWKEYRKLSETEIVEWHVGGHNSGVTFQAVNEITDALNNLR